MQWRGVRRLSVCPSVNFCADRFFSHKNGRIATELSQDGLHVEQRKKPIGNHAAATLRYTIGLYVKMFLCFYVELMAAA